MISTGRRVALIVAALTARTVLTNAGLLADASAVDISPVEDAIICTCGCPNMVLSTCLCGHSEEMREEIVGLYEGGMADGEVLETLIDRYGERVLATPKQEGFNLTAYTMPFLAILFGGGLVLVLVGRWKKNAGAGDDPRTASPALSGDDPYRERLEQELASHED